MPSIRRDITTPTKIQNQAYSFENGRPARRLHSQGELVHSGHIGKEGALESTVRRSTEEVRRDGSELHEGLVSLQYQRHNMDENVAFTNDMDQNVAFANDMDQHVAFQNSMDENVAF